MFDFNPANNTTAKLALQPPPLTANNTLEAFYQRLLMLPNGQMLYNSGSSLYIYTPSSTVAAPPYRPVIQGIAGSSPAFTLTGLQLNGQSAGAYYGDDVVTDENYPIVRLMSGSNVCYCKSTNWSNTAVGNTGPETVTFTVPVGVPTGNYTVIVSGAGVQSAGFAWVYPGSGT